MVPVPTALVLGQLRHIATSISAALAGTVNVTGVLTPSPQTPFSRNAVLSALHILHPRPSALIVGGGFSDAEADVAERAYRDFLKEIGREGKGVYVRVKPGDLETGGKDAVVKAIEEQLRKGLEAH